MSKLTSRQAAFCRHYIQGKSGAEAARLAGYKNAGRQAYQLLEKTHIKEHLAELQSQADSESIMSAREVLERYTDIARGEGLIPRSTPTGIHELPPDWSDRLKALQELAKYHNLSVEKRIISFEKHPDDMTATEVLEALSALSE